MNKYPSAQLTAALKKESSNAYLVINDEPLLLGEDRDRIRRALACDERQLFFVESDFDFDTATNAAAVGDLFSTKILLEFICAEPLGATAANHLTRIASAAAANNIAMLVGCPSLTKRGKWTDQLIRTFTMITQDKISAQQTTGWIKARARKTRLRLDDEAAELLASMTEGNLSMAAQELNKLAMLHGDDAHINLIHMRQGIADATRDSVFSLREALAAGDAIRALRAIRNLRAERTATPIIIWALAEEGRALLTLQGGGKPWGLFGEHRARLQDIAHRIRPGDVLTYLAGLARVDWAAKGLADSDAWLGCERLAIAFTMLARRNRLAHELVAT